MIREELPNGDLMFRWTPDETKQKQAFEEVLLAEHAVEQMMHALLKATAAANREIAKAWGKIGEMTGLDSVEYRIEYSWVTGCVEAKRRE